MRISPRCFEGGGTRDFDSRLAVEYAVGQLLGLIRGDVDFELYSRADVEREWSLNDARGKTGSINGDPMRPKLAGAKNAAGGQSRERRQYAYGPIACAGADSRVKEID